MRSPENRDFLSRRYERQIPLFGSEGQNRLGDATVLIAGAGGLGSPVATYLALAGVGELVIVDYDDIQESNLNRQFLHATASVGLKKVYSAEATLRSLQPDLSIVTYPEKIDASSAGRLISDADLVVDALDNYEARFLLHEAAWNAGIPFIHGAVEGFCGQLTSIIPGESPCLSCLIPSPPPAAPVPVVGATAGVIGSLQAMEVIKYITGTGRLLSGRLLIWDGLSGRTDYLKISRREGCPVCSRTAGS